MIRYPITRTELEGRIEHYGRNDLGKTRATWLGLARSRTERFREVHHYAESKSIWSEIKPVFMRLQHNKCAFCERRLESAEHGGAIEHALEHFRPKGTVSRWDTTEVAGQPVDFPLGDAAEVGYYWLAYDLMNYSASCHTCNSPLKSSYFPIAGPRGSVPADMESPDAALAALDAVEKPYLVYPIGNRDADPEEIMTFAGIVAVPKSAAGRRRAEVMIDFFKLNEREELRRERAEKLCDIDKALTVIGSDATAAKKIAACRDLERLKASGSPHASCVRAMSALCVADPDAAESLFNEAREFLESLHDRERKPD